MFCTSWCLESGVTGYFLTGVCVMREREGGRERDKKRGLTMRYIKVCVCVCGWVCEKTHRGGRTGPL